MNSGKSYILATENICSFAQVLLNITISTSKYSSRYARAQVWPVPLCPGALSWWKCFGPLGPVKNFFTFTAFRDILYSCVLLILWQQFREGTHVSVYILLAIQCTVSPFRLLDRGMQIDHCQVQLCFFPHLLDPSYSLDCVKFCTMS